MMTYLTGDATEPMDVEGKKIIAHIVNNKNVWGAGFALALGQKYPKTKEEYHKGIVIPNTNYQQRRALTLGDVQLVRLSDSLFVANMCAQNGLNSYSNPIPLNYGALLMCLRMLRAMCVNMGIASVHMPRIGSGLAGGNWYNISTIINSVFDPTDIQIYVYDLNEMD